MPDTTMDLEDTPVLMVRADMKGKGPSDAFRILEEKLPTLKGRKFYGTFKELPNGEEEYYACVVRVESDDPGKMKLETGLIPGGKYARRRIDGWEKVVREGKLPGMFNDFAKSHLPQLDNSRPSLEYYRSRDELFIFVPVRTEAR